MITAREGGESVADSPQLHFLDFGHIDSLLHA